MKRVENQECLISNPIQQNDSPTHRAVGVKETMTVEKQIEHKVAVCSRGAETAKARIRATIERESLCCEVRSWMDRECVGTSSFTTNVKALWHAFCVWSGRHCTLEEFEVGLKSRGFLVDRGMVEGLALASVFLEAIDDEHRRLTDPCQTEKELRIPEHMANRQTNPIRKPGSRQPIRSTMPRAEQEHLPTGKRNCQ